MSIEKFFLETQKVSYIKLEHSPLTNIPNLLEARPFIVDPHHPENTVIGKPGAGHYELLQGLNDHRQWEPFYDKGYSGYVFNDPDQGIDWHDNDLDYEAKENLEAHVQNAMMNEQFPKIHEATDLPQLQYVNTEPSHGHEGRVPFLHDTLNNVIYVGNEGSSHYDFMPHIPLHDIEKENAGVIQDGLIYFYSFDPSLRLTNAMKQLNIPIASTESNTSNTPEPSLKSAATSFQLLDGVRQDDEQRAECGYPVIKNKDTGEIWIGPLGSHHHDVFNKFWDSGFPFYNATSGNLWPPHTNGYPVKNPDWNFQEYGEDWPEKEKQDLVNWARNQKISKVWRADIRDIEHGEVTPALVGAMKMMPNANQREAAKPLTHLHAPNDPDMLDTWGFHANNRVPFIYSPQGNSVYYGTPNASHGEIMNHFPDLRYTSSDPNSKYYFMNNPNHGGEWNPQEGVSNSYYAARYLSDAQKAEIDNELRNKYPAMNSENPHFSQSLRTRKHYEATSYPRYDTGDFVSFIYDTANKQLYISDAGTDYHFGIMQNHPELWDNLKNLIVGRVVDGSLEWYSDQIGNKVDYDQNSKLKPEVMQEVANRIGEGFNAPDGETYVPQ